MKRSSRIPRLALAFVLVGLLGFLVGVVFTMEARFPNNISHAFSKAPDAESGYIYPASCAILSLLHDADLSGQHELRYVLRVSASTGDREYEPITFSVEDLGSLVDANKAVFDWNTEQPELVFQLGNFQRCLDLGEKLSIHSKPKNS
jgi:hypothetical protein